MELLAHAEMNGGPQGRWIVTPRKGMPFLGQTQRQRSRVLERRRRVLVVMLEAIGITFLIGLLPPLRGVWVLTFILGGALVAYVYMLISLKEKSKATGPRQGHDRTRAARAPRASSAGTQPQRYVAEGNSTWPRPNVKGFGTLGEGDRVHVVVREA
jgi:hypothetical protein